ncbi:MAG: hypothetical protein QF568_02715 [Flavobacteriales bacterium]|nr:hypothetical protein [Flavobacteriales bacterium]
MVFEHYEFHQLKIGGIPLFKGIENKSEKVRYVYADGLAERMKFLGREDLAVKCHQFLRNVFNEEQRVLV